MHGAIASSGISPPVIAWNIENTQYSSTSKEVTSSTTNADGNINFSSDGSKMYVFNSAVRTVYQWNLSTDWDITSATYSSESLSISQFNAEDYKFSADGTKIYFCGENTLDATQYVREYYLTTAWDVTTLDGSPEYYEFSVDAQVPSSMTGLLLKSDGTKFWVLDITSDAFKQYSMTAWDLSTASYDSGSDSADIPALFGVFGSALDPVWKPDGTKLYIVDSITDAVHQANLSTAWDMSTLTDSGQSFDLNSETAQPHGLYFRDTGLSFWISSTNTPSASTCTVFEYELV